MGDKICGYTQHHKNRKETLQFVQHKSGHNGENIPNVWVFLPDPTTRQEYSVACVDIANIAYNNNKYDA